MSVLHLFCGKIASGKSTLATRFAQEPNSVLISQDGWLAQLFPGEIKTLPDYVRCSGRLRNAMGPHITSLLRLNVSVSLDFPANTRAARTWMRQIFEGAGVGHQLHYLDVPDELCLERLHLRNAKGEHDYVVSDDEFFQFGEYFQPPETAEGFQLILHRPGSRQKSLALETGRPLLVQSRPTRGR
jgi:predicted kinase